VAETAYRLHLDGATASADTVGAVESIEVEDDARLAGMARVVFTAEVDPDDAVWSLLESGSFGRLRPLRVEVEVGEGGFHPLLDGFVVDTRVRFAEGAQRSRVEVTAMDPSVKLGLEEKARAWPDTSDSAIAQAIFGEHGLVADVEATGQQPSRDEATTVQRGTDIQFLRHLADRNGFECYVEADPATGAAKGHFHPPRLDGTPQGVLTFSLGDASNLAWLEARHDLLRPAVAVARAVHPGNLQTQEAELRAGSWPSLGTGGLAASSDPRTLLLANSGLASAGELQAYAQAAVDRSLLALAVEGEADATLYGGILRAKRMVLLRGVGTRFSGTYYVERVLHTLSPQGYRQRFALRRNALGETGGEAYPQHTEADGGGPEARGGGGCC
jgi:phage protein D